MSKDRITMSQQERDRLKVMDPVLNGKRTQVEAARLLGRSIRQVRRIQRRMESEGDIGIKKGSELFYLLVWTVVSCVSCFHCLLETAIFLTKRLITYGYYSR